MFFCIIGDNHNDIVITALSYLHPTDLFQIKKNIVVFNTEYPERLAYCWAIIKWGTIVKPSELETQVSGSSLLWVATKELWGLLKKQITSVKRYKIVDLIHSDMEIKKEGKEIINIDGQRRWIVQGYQNIDLYETIDFGKPVGGMTVGMMPSKLAHQLINIGVGEYEKEVINYKSWVISWGGKTIDWEKDLLNTYNLTLNTSQALTIRDPFCGFGTTNFLANHLSYNTIASDLNVTSIKQNRKRRLTLPLSNSDSKSTILKQDVTQPFSPLSHHADIIVSEGWLGHIITNATRPKEAENSSIAVEKLYKEFLSNLTELKTQNSKPLTLVITIPVWIKHNHNFSVSESIAQHARKLWRDITLIPEPYSRPGQLVGRQVMIGKFIKQ